MIENILNTQGPEDIESEKFKHVPVLISNFSAIRKNPEISPVVSELPNDFYNKESRRHSFEEARDAFEFVFDKEKLLYHLEQKENEESLAYIKQVRRCGLSLRDLYRFFDVSHRCVEKLYKLMPLLCKYKDNYWGSPQEEIKKEIFENLDDLEFPINFGEDSKFKEYVKNVLLEIKQLLMEKQLPVEKFHTLRKRIRLFASLVQPAAAENCGGNFHWLFFSLFKLSEEMGDHHDDLVSRGLNGEINYSESIVNVSPYIVSEFEKLKPFIERVCGLAE
ncbi:MAG: hypothetical protein WCW54_03965 [Candidatus Paceibacterota bacterium]